MVVLTYPPWIFFLATHVQTVQKWQYATSRVQLHFYSVNIIHTSIRKNSKKLETWNWDNVAISKATESVLVSMELSLRDPSDCAMWVGMFFDMWPLFVLDHKNRLFLTRMFLSTYESEKWKILIAFDKPGITLIFKAILKIQWPWPSHNLGFCPFSKKN